MAFDVEHHRLFAGCHNKMAVVMDSDFRAKWSQRCPSEMAWMPARFNPKTQEIFMSCGEGVLTIIHEDSPDKYTVTQNLPTVQRSSHHGAGHRRTTSAYLVTAHARLHSRLRVSGRRWFPAASS